MGTTAEWLAALRPRIEAEVKPRLAGFFGGFVRAYLPQTWVFRTEHESASLVIDGQGNARVQQVALPSPDVTVEGTESALHEAFESRGSRRPHPGSITVTPHTAKGKAVLDYLRPRLGL